MTVKIHVLRSMNGLITMSVLDARKAQVVLSEKECVRLINLLTEAVDAPGWYGKVVTIDDKESR